MKKKLSSARVPVLATVLVLCAISLGAQVAKDANERYQTAAGRATIAKSLSSPDRDQTQKPEELVAAMSLKPGMTVADIGTGTGYMLPFLSAAVGSGGRVIGEDIFPDFLNDAQANAKHHKLGNVSFTRGTETDPSLPEDGVDVALALDTYHHWNYPQKMLAALHGELREGGRLVLVEFHKGAAGLPQNHIRLDEPDVIKEIEANHFRLVSKHEHSKDQYMAIFEKN